MITASEGCPQFDERLRTWPADRRRMREWLQSLSGIEYGLGRLVARIVEHRADIASGADLILTETPTETIEISDDPVTFRAAVWKTMDSSDAFLRSKQDLLIAKLS
jgi:hypothetical protein